jgi:hypothetical protein
MSKVMRNATSIVLLGASTLVLSMTACGGADDGATRDPSKGGSSSTSAGGSSQTGTAGTTPGTAGTGTGTAGTSTGTGGGGACVPLMGKKGDGMNKVIDDIDDTNTMFATAGVGMGSWDFSKDANPSSMITPAGTAMLVPVEGGQSGTALHVQGTGLAGWGASLAAFLNGPTSAFDGSDYDGVAFYIKGTSAVLEGANKVMVQARMPDVLLGPGSCCDDKVAGKECYSGHRVVIDITAEWQEVKIEWTQFKGPTWGLGSTLAFNPNRIRDINLSFNHDATMASAPPASFDVWVDSVRFLAKGEKGNIGGGTGGTGGTGSGGTGGTGGSGGAGGSGGTAGGTGGASGGTGGAGGTAGGSGGAGGTN